MPAVVLFALWALCPACTAAGPEAADDPAPIPARAVLQQGPGITADAAPDLESIAEIERAGAYFPGLGLAESALREKAGDFAGAAVAAYKELSWAYGYGAADIGKVEEGLQSALALAEGSFPDSAVMALKGCIAFAREDWEQAERLLLPVLLPDEDPDSFLRWMLLVCALEQEAKKAGGGQGRSAYGAIRARYAPFPEYWYRGARAFSPNEGITAFYAEQCINASPGGPFAADCRKILALYLGLAPEDAGIRTKTEIENTIRASVSMNNPAILEDLFPLMSLPENPYTLYALGALSVLSSVPGFRDFFTDGALKSPGRLGERLSYISRG